MSQTQAGDVKSQIVEFLGRGPRKARFVSEVAGQLARADVTHDVLECELQELESSGQALIREQYCGDPHLFGTDLRIVALVEPGEPGKPGYEQDSLARAIDDIGAVWDRWLADYLSNHRCG
ncbi:MAG: hypothetical protein JO057_31180 [Chloroflexi bacterium]|nr:hypothetical protein [Chloroflexota bacterium]